MIDIQILRKQPDLVKKNLEKRCKDPSIVDKLVSIDEKRRELIHETETIQAEKNKMSEKIPKMDESEKKKAISGMQKLTVKEKELNPKLQEIEKKFQELFSQLPNFTIDSVPFGKDENDSQVVKTHGKKPNFAFLPKDHIELGKKLDLIDIETAVNMSGARFYYLKNEAVLLEFALVQHILHKLAGKGFSPIIPPVLVKESAMWATGFFPADRNEIYEVNPNDDKLFLVGTAEVPLTMLYADKTLNLEEMPRHFVGFSSCFRREAGSYGKDVAGILRVHQFDKLEMYSFCHPSKSEEEHELIRSIEEEIMQDLGFHYQVVAICSGDLGYSAAKKYDIEVWIPTQNKFRELTSCSNCTDYQSRRANIKFNEKGKKQLVHTLNGTACAIGRTLIAILENYQNKDSSITIPEVLRQYTRKDTIELKR